MKQIRTSSVTAIGALALAACLLGQPSAAWAQDDQIATANGNLTIHPVHHGSVVLTWNGKRIVVDPAGFPPGATSAAADFKGAAAPDLILITHEHGDHFSVPTLSELVGANTVLVVPQSAYAQLPAALQAKAKVMKNGEEQVHAGVDVEAVPEYNITADRMNFHPKGRDNGYVLTLGGKRVYLAGDTEANPDVKGLANIDVAFIPMNLPYTQTVQAAADWVKTFKPKIVYPYHYGESDVKQFQTLVGNDSEVRLRKWY